MEDWEKFIGDERARFDQVEEVPHEVIWQGINSKLRRKSLPIIRWMAIAASVALVLAAGMMIQHQLHKEKSISPATYSWESIEWQAEQARLVNLVNLKKNEIGFDTIEVRDFPMVFDQLKMQESHYEELIADREVYPDEDALLKVLIKYHERQLQLLETLARETKKKEIRNEKLLY